MTPEELRTAINYLFEAHGGQRALARTAGTNDSSIRRYLMGTRKIPHWLGVLIAYLYERKRAGLSLDIDVEGNLKDLLERAENSSRSVVRPLPKTFHSTAAN